MNVVEEIEEFIKTLPLECEFSTKWFKKVLKEKYGRSDGSYIPSDYCYNITNNGIIYEKQPHYFLHLSRGKYRYVGKNYNFKEKVERRPKKKPF